jgi:molecular chaperone GrpE
MEESVSKENKSEESYEEVEVVEDGNGSLESEQGIGEDDAPSVEEVWDPEKALVQALEEIADLRDKMLRGAAENENFKKRMARERSASLKYAGEQILREMLPVVDNLERAIDQGEAGGEGAGKNLESFVEGVKLTLKNLAATLEKFEVKSIESVGEPFDPKHHEALTMEASDTVPANHVLKEFEKGYYYKDRLLRAAKVIVSSGNA